MGSLIVPFLLRSVLGSRVPALGTMLAVSVASAATAQSPDPLVIADSLARTIDRATIVGDASGLRGARTLATRGLAAYPDHPLLTHHRAAAIYREASLAMDTSADRAQRLLDEAQELLDTAVQHPQAIAETHALRASVMGMRITGLLRAMTLGPQSGRAIDRAREADPENPRIWLASGIGTLHRPAFLGGGPDSALKELERAESLLGVHRSPPGHPVGGAAEIRAWIGVAHLRAGRPDEAVAALQSALELEPEFVWVREVLLPQAERAAAERGPSLAAGGVSHGGAASRGAEERGAHGGTDRSGARGRAHQSMHHSVANAPWDERAVPAVARDWPLTLLERHAPIGAWVVDEMGMPKKGKHSVGVA